MTTNLPATLALGALALACSDAAPPTSGTQPAATGSATGTSTGASTGSSTGTSEGSTTGTSAPPPGGPPPVPGTDSPGDPTVQVGTFIVTLIDENPTTSTPALSSIQGFVRDAPLLTATVWDLAAEEGPCKLETPRFPGCDPMCTSDQTCAEEDTCVDDPIPNDVGVVTVYGLDTEQAVEEVRMTPIGSSNNYSVTGGVRIDYPPTAEGSSLRLVTEGGDYTPFEVSTTGIAPLDITSPVPIPFEPGAPTRVEWTPAGESASSTITVLVDISHHGGAKGRIVCEVPDTGSVEISGAFVSQLIELGTAGGPTIKLTRKATGSTTIETGRVDFIVTQGRELPLDIPGLITCGDGMPCPEGMTCPLTRACVPE